MIRPKLVAINSKVELSNEDLMICLKKRQSNYSPTPSPLRKSPRLKFIAKTPKSEINLLNINDSPIIVPTKINQKPVYYKEDNGIIHNMTKQARFNSRMKKKRLVTEEQRIHEYLQLMKNTEDRELLKQLLQTDLSANDQILLSVFLHDVCESSKKDPEKITRQLQRLASQILPQTAEQKPRSLSRIKSAHTQSDIGGELRSTLKTITIKDLSRFWKNNFPSKQTQELTYFLLIFLSQFDDNLLGGTKLRVSTAWRTFRFWGSRPGEVVRALKILPDKLDR